MKVNDVGPYSGFGLSPVGKLEDSFRDSAMAMRVQERSLND